MSRVPLPNFIVIGPGRSGTTWMYQMLKQHPEVCVSSAKETLYFEEGYEKGLNWYGRFFRHCKGSNAIGEVSNTYFFSRLVAERIWNYNSDMRLISPLRNPIERLFSLYIFALRTAQLEGSFEEFINKNEWMLERHEYMGRIENYLRYFHREQVLIILYDDLRENPVNFAKQIYRFVDVSEEFVPGNVHERIEGAGKYRNKYLSKVLKKSALLIRYLGYPEIVTKVKEKYLSKVLYEAFSVEKYPKMSEETRKRLEKYYYRDIRETSALVGRDLVSAWLGCCEKRSAIAVQGCDALEAFEEGLGRANEQR